MEFTSDITVELIQHVGSDAGIAAAARVSTGLDLDDHTKAQDAGLIRYLVKARHGSPLEHNSVTFRVQAPIFVFREWQRHRIASYNEVSGRYKKLEPKFYIYPESRPLIQDGSGAHPRLIPGSPVLTKITNGALVADYHRVWATYEELLGHGVANEVARAVLPVGIYSEMYVTMNLRAALGFISLRVDHPDNTFTTKPQWEIQQAAEQVEAHIKALFPDTWAAFVMHGRVAP